MADDLLSAGVLSNEGTLMNATMNLLRRSQYENRKDREELLRDRNPMVVQAFQDFRDSVLKLRERFVVEGIDPDNSTDVAAVTFRSIEEICRKLGRNVRHN